MTNVWYSFIDLHNSRSYGFQANPIAYSEILAYYTLHQTVPDLWEIGAIKRLDQLYMQVTAEKREREERRKEQQNRR